MRGWVFIVAAILTAGGATIPALAFGAGESPSAQGSGKSASVPLKAQGAARQHSSFAGFTSGEAAPAVRPSVSSTASANRAAQTVQPATPSLIVPFTGITPQQRTELRSRLARGEELAKPILPHINSPEEADARLRAKGAGKNE